MGAIKYLVEGCAHLIMGFVKLKEWSCGINKVSKDLSHFSCGDYVSDRGLVHIHGIFCALVSNLLMSCIEAIKSQEGRYNCKILCVETAVR